MSSFFRKLFWLARRRNKEADLQDELRFHLDEEAAERQSEGSPDEKARRSAHLDLGNITLVRENTRSAWSWTFLEQTLQDLRYGFRAMAGNKTFSALAILSLALGIGANTAIFSFMDSILLRSLPVSAPESLVVLKWRSPGTRRNPVMHETHGSAFGDSSGIEGAILPYAALELFQKNDAVFSSVFGFYHPRDMNLIVQGQADVAKTEFVTGDYFSGLGLSPAAGRLLFADDDRVGAPAAAVLSFALSQRRYGGPWNSVGKTILINKASFTVVGVAPPEFFGTAPGTTPEIYLPMHASLLMENARPGASWFSQANNYWIEIMGRLRPGVTLAQTQARLAGPFHQWVASTASTDEERRKLPSLSVREGAGGLDRLRHRYSKPLYLLMTLVGLILAIACANIANLLLARATARRREMAVRLSIGAGRIRVIRQLLTESLLLALVGGAASVAIAVWGIRFLTVLLANTNAELVLRAELNWHVLAATAGLALLAGILFGLAPAIQSTRVDIMPALKESRTGESRARIARSFRRLSLSQALIVSQIAITLLILVAAGLFVRTLANVQSLELGFNRENLLSVQLSARQAGHRDPEIAVFYENLRKRFAAIPGVRSASLANWRLIGEGTYMTDVSVLGEPAANSDFLNIGLDFFKTMQIPILMGRGIDERDRPGSLPVAVVNERFVRTFFGGRNPIGQRLVPNHDDRKRDEVEIVGVCGNARYGSLKSDMKPVIYLPFSQAAFTPVDEMIYQLRTAGNPLLYVNAIREIVHQADPRIPLSGVMTQSEQLDRTMSQEITFARLCTAFAILALVISSVGLYATVSYNVSRQTAEIGIRMALGAQRRRVTWMVLRGVLALAAVGLALSFPAAYAASKLVASFLFDVQPNDPATMAFAVIALVLASVLAGYLPAWKASQIDPMTALRHE